ncbi:MAG: alpha/beta hydrolase [Chloroflexi bacterium]|nr:alpha/beta hydrolase [Chloroflexota bacterium]
MPTIQFDDLKLFYQVRGEGDQPVLALHPSTVTGTLFTWAIPRQEQYANYIPDQRGHGKTPNPASDFHIDRFINDMVKFVEEMGFERFHGIGYSLGAAVLLGLTQIIPTKMKSLVIIGSTHVRPNEEQRTRVAGPPHKREGLVKAIMDEENGVSQGWDFSLSKLGAMECPVSIIIGDRDPICPLHEGHELYEAFPQGNLFVVPGAGHFGYHTSDMVRSYLKEWYDQF